MLPAILICAFMVKNVATQRTATATLGTTKSCVLIGDDVKLLCTVSADCCTTFPRVWKKVAGAVELLNNGGSSDASKYVEDYDGVGTTGFNLIIKNVQKSDFGLDYKCSYGVTESNLLYLNDILCDCGECAGQDYGWSILGDVIGTIIILIITQIKLGEPKTTLIVGGLTFIISAVVNAIIAVPIGYYVCHCVDVTARWLIGLGLGTSVIIGVIVLIIAVNKQKQDAVKCCLECCEGCCEVCRMFICSASAKLKNQGAPIVQVEQSSYSVTTGSTVVLVCTVTSDLTITSVEWERNVDGIKTTIVTNTNKYRGSSTTTPSLTIFNAEFSDEGTYTCVAFNRDGTGQSTTTLRVTGR